MRSFFAHNDISQYPKFCGRMMLGRLDDDLRVKLELVSTYIADQYNRYHQTLIIVIRDPIVASQCRRIVTLEDGKIVSDISNKVAQ